MKKTIIIIASIVVVIGLAVGGYFLGWLSFLGLEPVRGSDPEFIGYDAAKQIALEDAQVDTDSVMGLKADFEREHGTSYYEVDFRSNGMEYEYYIGAETGNIIDCSKEFDD